MGAPVFPCRRVTLQTPCEDPRALAMSWISNRKSDDWALISGTALASDVHAWAAYNVLIRNRERTKMKSNSIDGEFIRLLSGTHHIATSFNRAGLQKGDTTAWLVDLSCSNLELEFVEHADKMDFTLLDDRPNLEIFDSSRMGIVSPKNENAAIAHIHLADIR
ncbi:EKC/KEOPS complex subunit CGI121/TPRKB [Candidatus Poseidoniaceae archaeon]|nr:EKC/KEOPS complex subunit CGI121/TPRKB [Candidatus Poseidoniaceae archaeon]